MKHLNTLQDFTLDATDGTEGAMVNVVSGRGLGDTFSGGAVISSIGPVTLNSSDATGASKSVLGYRIGKNLRFCDEKRQIQEAIEVMGNRG